MKKLLFALLMIITATGSAMAEDSLKKDPAVIFVDNIANRFINEIFTSSSTEQEKVSTFKKEFLENSDIAFISKFVLGKAWKKADADAKANFEKVFSNAVVLSWASRFKEYNGQSLEIKATRPAQSGQIYVDTSVVSPDSAVKPIDLIWRLKNVDGAYKISDLIVEGVSMAMTYRNEYLAVLQAHNNDVAVLCDVLAKRNAELAKKLGVEI